MTKYNQEFKVGKNSVGGQNPTYFIADIAANHDGSLSRAKELIHLAKEAGADCAKFQHFSADKIVSDYGFKNDNVGKVSHQSSWNKSVFEIYDQYHTRKEWTEELVSTCKEVGIEFMTAPYDLDAVRELNPYLNAFKVGSGDITFKEELELISSYNKPVFLATGASSLEDVSLALDALGENKNICLMQCNTNYTGLSDNLNYINLNVLIQYKKMYEGIVLGLSDHTHGHATVLGAISLGAKAIEKHFTDDNDRIGPDHKFAMNPKSWKDMVIASRELEAALGDGNKKVEDNEKETVVIQRRAIRTNRPMQKGEVISEENIEFLRPCPVNSIDPRDFKKIIGMKTNKNLESGEELYWEVLEN